jgi:hypothetical protein
LTVLTVLTLPLLKVGPLQHVDASREVHDSPASRSSRPW